MSPQDRYGLAILTIVANYVIAVTITGPAGAAWSVFLGLCTILLVFAVSQARIALRVAAAVVPVSFLSACYVTVSGPAAVESAMETPLVLVSIALYLMAPVLVLRHIVTRPQVDVQTLYAAVAAYLLIGMMFGFAYKAVGNLQQAPPLFGDQGPGTMAQVLFFSFVTLTTTGYGNLVPADNPGQSLAVLEAILGQLFLVTAVAKIVTAWNPARRFRAADTGAPDDHAGSAEST